MTSNQSQRPQPTPRMTDSASGPNGPHSLAFASLSVQSYHLDSPPFIGTSMGSYGPLAQEGERLAAQDNSEKAHNGATGSNHNPSSLSQSPSPSPIPTIPAKHTPKKGSSPLSRAVKVDEMSRIVDQNQDHAKSQQQGLNEGLNRNRDRDGDGDGDNGLDQSRSSHPTASAHSQTNGGAKDATLNSLLSDRDVPKWQLDGSTSSTSSSSQSLSSQSSSTSPSPSTMNSIDSNLNLNPISNSISRGPPPFTSRSASGSGESSGISTPISNFKSNSSTSSSSSRLPSSLPNPPPSHAATQQSGAGAYSGGKHSSMESNSHSHAGSISPPIVDQPQSFARQRIPSNNDQVRRDDSIPRPAYTQLASQDSSSEHEGDGDEADGPSGITRHPVDEEVDGDDTAFVIQHGQSNGGIGGTTTGVGTNGNPNGPARGVPVQGSSKEQYKFPRHRLPTRMRDESKTPLVIVACGSFSPPTYLHLRIFEMAKDQIIESGKYELLGGYYSPVSDYYKKEGLAPARHRVRMCELAVEKTSTWLMVDAWESLQDEYQRTAVVLDHFDDEINGPRLAKTNSRPNTAVNANGGGGSSSDGAKERGGVLLSDGSRKRIKIMLLAGGDLIQSMGEPGIWASADLHHILGRYGCLIVERTGADVWSFLLSHDLLWRYRRNLKIVKQTIYNDISSSKVRLFVRRGQSIKYLLPNSVIHYIEKHKLYRLPPAEEHDEAALEDENW